MPKLWSRKGYPAVSFVSINLPDERFQMMKTKDELSKMSEDSSDAFKRNMLDRYIDRPNKTFLDGKYEMCDNFCLAQFWANYRVESKDNYDEIVNDCQPVVLNENVIEENHESNQLPKTVPLMSSKEVLKCRKVQKVLRYFTPNKDKFPEKFSHHLLMLFYPFRDEESDLKLDCSYAKKLAC